MIPGYPVLDYMVLLASLRWQKHLANCLVFLNMMLHKKINEWILCKIVLAKYQTYEFPSEMT